MSLARVAIGISLLAEPRLATTAWLGRAPLRASGRVLARALGARDLVIGLGTLMALGRGGAVRPWLVAGMLADSADVAITIAERDSLPPTAVPLVVATGGVGAAMGAYALADTGDATAPSAPVPA
jgi:hypothetical protein